MPTYVALIKFTPKGIQHIKKSPSRATQFRKEVQRGGGRVHQIFWAMGTYDGVLVFDAPGDEVATALMLRLAGKGNVKTETLRTFNEREFDAVLKRM
ncbi:MAG: GYD domain-containing protein [Planctomycetes bacterium]|nr:GYD domain-containing protein [Planctomycetota bacterium]